MDLENIVLDAVDPALVGRFWEAGLGGERLSDGPDGFETRLPIPGGPAIDLCVQPVPQPPAEPLRLHLDLLGGDRQRELVDRFLGLGARHLDIGQGEVPWVVLADPEGNPFCVMEHREVYSDTGPIAALPLDSADPARDVEFWAWLTGWVPAPGVSPHSLRHPSRRGPLLELCPEPAPKGAGKNRVHLDVRLGPEDDADAVAAGIAARGGRELDPGWGDLPWRVYTDPSGNELCVLPATSTNARASPRSAG
ncbi:VOC family protein [Georgenia satyanarayanai]|uniref:VOC family protein n=1 Tax=Georgenia satyanarayanai TaxID=860221 RepID=UPI00126529A8|nr:VOC family protein [Georgenia satyanarayanai]